MTFTLELNPITTPRRRVDRYEIAIMPPVLLPSSQLSSPLNLTLQTSTLYDITITSINCFGSASIQRQLGNVFESAHHSPHLLHIFLGYTLNIVNEATNEVSDSLSLNMDDKTTVPNILCTSNSEIQLNLRWARRTSNGLPNGVTQSYEFIPGRQQVSLVWNRKSIASDSGVYICMGDDNFGDKDEVQLTLFILSGKCSHTYVCT